MQGSSLFLVGFFFRSDVYMKHSCLKISCKWYVLCGCVLNGLLVGRTNHGAISPACIHILWYPWKTVSGWAHAGLNPVTLSNELAAHKHAACPFCPQTNTIANVLPHRSLGSITASTCNPVYQEALASAHGNRAGAVPTPLPLRRPSFPHRCAELAGTCFQVCSASLVALGLCPVLPCSEMILRKTCLCTDCSHFPVFLYLRSGSLCP